MGLDLDQCFTDYYYSTPAAIHAVAAKVIVRPIHINEKKVKDNLSKKNSHFPEILVKEKTSPSYPNVSSLHQPTLDLTHLEASDLKL